MDIKESYIKNLSLFQCLGQDNGTPNSKDGVE